MQIKIILRTHYMLLRKSKLEISPIVVVDEDKIRALIYLLLMRLKEKGAIITLEGRLVSLHVS